MDNSKAKSVRPKIVLHVWSNPHLNTLVAMTNRNSNIVKAPQDYAKDVKPRPDLTSKPVNFFQDETADRRAGDS
jgi:hypothetical protein